MVPLHNLLLLLVVSGICEATLSKSDRKLKQPAVSKTSKEVKQEARHDDIQLELHPEDVTVDTITAEHNVVYYEQKIFPNPALGYVTPWNNRGYDIAKWAAAKFTHIAPVWFQMNPGLVDGQKTCKIAGTHDIDQGWIKDVRSNNSEIEISPRVIFEGWAPSELKDFLQDEMWQIRCVRSLTDLLQSSGMQGAVVEIWLQALSVTRGEMREELIELIESWADYFHSKDLEFILPITPPLDAKYRLNGIITSAEFANLTEHVDYINIMTYDYQSDTGRLQGVAPFDWVRRNIEYLLSESPVSATKVLMGINFYGYEVTSGSVSSVLASRYLEIISNSNVKLAWDPSSMEHYAKSEKSLCYYPSLTSIGARLDLARYLHVGIGIWDIGQGLDYFTKLL